MNRQENDTGLFEKPAGKGLVSSSIYCPIIQSGSPIWALARTTNFVGRSEYNEVLVWDMSKFKRWKGPEQTLDLRRIMYIEDELTEEEFDLLIDGPPTYTPSAPIIRHKPKLSKLIEKNRRDKELELESVKSVYSVRLMEFLANRIASVRVMAFSSIKPSTKWVIVLAENGTITSTSLAFPVRSPYVSREEEADMKEEGRIKKDLTTEVMNDRFC